MQSVGNVEIGGIRQSINKLKRRALNKYSLYSSLEHTARTYA